MVEVPKYLKLDNPSSIWRISLTKLFCYTLLVLLVIPLVLMQYFSAALPLDAFNSEGFQHARKILHSLPSYMEPNTHFLVTAGGDIIHSRHPGHVYNLALGPGEDVQIAYEKSTSLEGDPFQAARIKYSKPLAKGPVTAVVLPQSILLQDTEKMKKQAKADAGKSPAITYKNWDLKKEATLEFLLGAFCVPVPPERFPSVRGIVEDISESREEQELLRRNLPNIQLNPADSCTRCRDLDATVRSLDPSDEDFSTATVRVLGFLRRAFLRAADYLFTSLADTQDTADGADEEMARLLGGVGIQLAGMGGGSPRRTLWGGIEPPPLGLIDHDMAGYLRGVYAGNVPESKSLLHRLTGYDSKIVHALETSFDALFNMPIAEERKKGKFTVTKRPDGGTEFRFTGGDQITVHFTSHYICSRQTVETAVQDIQQSPLWWLFDRGLLFWVVWGGLYLRFLLHCLNTVIMRTFSVASLVRAITTIAWRTRNLRHEMSSSHVWRLALVTTLVFTLFHYLVPIPLTYARYVWLQLIEQHNQQLRSKIPTESALLGLLFTSTAQVIVQLIFCLWCVAFWKDPQEVAAAAVVPEPTAEQFVRSEQQAAQGAVGAGATTAPAAADGGATRPRSKRRSKSSRRDSVPPFLASWVRRYNHWRLLELAKHAIAASSATPHVPDTLPGILPGTGNGPVTDVFGRTDEPMENLASIVARAAPASSVPRNILVCVREPVALPFQEPTMELGKDSGGSGGGSGVASPEEAEAKMYPMSYLIQRGVLIFEGGSSYRVYRPSLWNAYGLTAAEPTQLPVTRSYLELLDYRALLPQLALRMAELRRTGTVMAPLFPAPPMDSFSGMFAASPKAKDE